MTGKPRRARWFHVLLIEPRTLAVTLMALVALVALMATLLLVGEVWQVTLVHLVGQDLRGNKVFLANENETGLSVCRL